MDHCILLVLSIDRIGIGRLPRALKRHGFKVDILAAPHFLICSSRFVDTRYESSPNPEVTANRLRDHLAVQLRPYDLVVIGDDRLLEVLARRAGEPWARALLPFCVEQVDPACSFSKLAFFELCKKHNLTIPVSAVIRADTMIDPQKEFQYPLILKKDTGCSGNGICEINSTEELVAYHHGMPKGTACLIQQKVLGRNLTVDVLFEKGSPRAWTCSYILHVQNSPFSASAVREYVNVPEVAPILGQLGLLTGAHGLLGLDFIHEQPSGRLVLLEWNCRPTVGHTIAMDVGVDFGLELKAMLAKKPALKQRQTKDRTIQPLFPEDLNRAISNKDWRGILRWALLPQYWRYMPWRDFPQMRWHFWHTLRRFGSRLWRHANSSKGKGSRES